MSIAMEGCGPQPRVYSRAEYETPTTHLAESEQQLTQLKAAIQHYEEALNISFPNGSYGKVFELWNNARKSIENT